MLRIADALRYCQSGYAAYFTRAGKRRSLDEVIARAATSNVISTEQLTDIHDRCASLIDSDSSAIGTADEWLNNATKAGNARAQLQTAARYLSELGLEAAKTGSISASSRKINKSDPRFSIARELIVDAATKDTGEALWMLGEHQLLLTGDEDRAEKSRWALDLAACKRGYDCSQSAAWYKDFCRGDLNCQPDETGADLIKRIAANHPDIDYLSDSAISKLESSKIDDLLEGKL